MSGKALWVVLLLVAAAAAWWFLAPEGAGPGGGGGDEVAPHDEGDAASATLAGGQGKKKAETPQPRGTTCALVGTVRREGRPCPARVEVYSLAPLERGTPPGWAASRRETWVPDTGALSVVPAAAGRSGADGRYAVDGLAPGAFEVTAIAEDGARGWTEATVPCEGGVGEADVEVRGGGETLEGRVVRADGKPWAGQVTVVSADENPARGLRLVAVGPDGRFSFGGLARGAVTVHAVAEGSLRVASKPVAVPQRGEFVLVIGAGWSTLTGRVATEAGKPIAGATVVCDLDSSGAAIETAKARAATDADGNFSILASTTGNRLAVTAPGFSRWDRWYSVVPSTPVDVRLAAAGRVAGRVLAQSAGTPVPGVAVYVARLGEMSSNGARGKSDAEGRYEVLDAPSGEVAVVAFGAGWMSPSALDAMTSGGEYNPLAVDVPAGASATVDVVVAEAGRAAGRVIDPSGAPVAGAIVLWRLVDEGGTTNHDLSWIGEALSVATGPDGTFAFDTLPPGHEVRFVATAAGFAPASAGPFAVEPEKAISAEVRLGTPRFADVTVTDATTGKGIPGATATATFDAGKGDVRTRAGVAGPEGIARVGPLPAGEVRIKATAPSYLASDHERAGGPDGSTEPVALTLRLAAAFTISGRVRRLDGSPPRDLTVMLEDSDGNGSGFDVGSDGSFTFSDLRVGSYEIVIYDDSPGEWEELARKTVRTGATDVELTVAGTNRPQLVVRILGPDGAPVPVATLSHDVNAWGVNTQEVHDGREEMGAPKKEAWFEAKRARTAAGTPLPYGPASLGPVAAGTTEVELRLPPERRIEGVVKDPAGGGMRGVRVSAKPADVPKFGKFKDEHGSARTDEQGRFRVGNLADGTYSLEVTPPPEYGPTPAVTAAAGATDVVITLVAGRTAQTTVLDPRGRPVAGATVRVRDADDGRRHAPGTVVYVGPGRSAGRFQKALFTDAVGVARFVGIPAEGKYVLDVTPPEDRPDLRATTVSPWTPADDSITLGVGLVLRGFVRDRAGRPVPGANVNAQIKDGAFSAESRSDGAFTIGGLGEGEAKLRATKEGDFGGESALVTTRTGTDGVVLVIDPGAELVVRIEGWPPNPGEWTWVVAVDEEQGTKWTRILADGTATFRGCNVNATYSLLVRLDTEPPLVGSLRGLHAGAAPARLTLGTGRTVTGTWKAPPGATNVEVHVEGEGLWAQAKVDKDGKFSVAGIPEGKWKVVGTAAVGGQGYSAQAETTAGGTVDLVFEPAKSGAPGVPVPAEAACGTGKCG